jgi:hypothetical protein
MARLSIRRRNRRCYKCYLSVRFVARVHSASAAGPRPEPLNPYDANAAAVCVNDDLGKVGYLAGGVAKSCHALLARRTETITCPGRLNGSFRTKQKPESV